MSQNVLQCKCGQRVRFTDDDRGFEVYCPSCGSAVAVPGGDDEPVAAAAPPSIAPPPLPTASAPKPAAPQMPASSPTPPPLRRPRPQGGVFSSAGLDKVVEKTVRETTCLCGRTITYTLEEIGTKVYCTCGNEVQIGADLDRREVGRATVVADAPPPQARFRFVRSRVGFTALVTVLGLTGAGAYYMITQTSLPELLNVQVDTVVKKARPAGPPAEFDPSKLDAEAIEALAKQVDFYAALKQALAWRQGLEDAAVAADDPRFAVIQRVIADVLERQQLKINRAITDLVEMKSPKFGTDEFKAWAEQTTNALDEWARVLRGCGLGDDHEFILLLRVSADRLTERVDPITLEMIDGLLTAGDSLASLQQGQLWREALDDRRAAANDPRRPRLDRAIAELRERLVPRSKPRPWLEQFRQLTKTLADKLYASDLAGARQARDACEKLLLEYPDDLGPLSPRYMSLKARLRTLELEIEGMQRIEALFVRAESAAAGSDLDQIGAGLEARDTARYLVRITPMTAAEAEALDRRFTMLKPKYQLSLGLRAVRDAERCSSAGDAAARDYQARRAAALLPGLPENQIGTAMQKVKPWLEDKDGKPLPAPKGPAATTDVGRRLLARDLYETALEHFGAGDTAALAEACKTYDRETKAAGIDDPAQAASLKNSLFDALEVQITQQLDDRAADPDEDPQAKLVQARAGLDTAVFWKGDPRWKALDGACQQRGETLGRDAVARAVKLAEAQRYEEAVVEIYPALSLGGPDAMQRAKALHDQWELEVQRRADAQAEAEQWALIGQLALDSKRALEAALELRRFLERYPSSARADEARQLQQTLRTAIDVAFAGEVAAVNKALADNRWPDAMKGLHELEAAAAGDAQQGQVQQLQRLVADKKTAVLREFNELGARKQLISVADTLHVLRVAGTLVLIDSTHADAVALLDKAKKRGAVLAAALVARSKGLKNLNPEKFQEDMRNAYWLDPYGEAGREARDLLAGGSKKS